MAELPASPDLDHLKKQAKRLLRDARSGDPAALSRLAATPPAASAGGPRPAPRLHDAQSAVAREYGFRSWPDLSRRVAWLRADRATRIATWLRWAYDGQPWEVALAARAAADTPDLLAQEPILACATGDAAAVRAALETDPGWAARPAGPRAMPPLIAVTHSRLIAHDAHAPGLLACADLLLAAGADVNARWTDPRYPDWPLSVLYGAAGVTHHAGLVRRLLDAGADPNDGESLYHATEAGDPALLRMLLDAGARVAGTNAIGRALDFGRLDDLRLLLSRGGDARERPWLHHAILRGRPLAAIRLLAEAGADLRAVDDTGLTVFRHAALRGRDDVLALLREAGIEDRLSVEESFIAACARGDVPAAEAIRATAPDILDRLSPGQRRALPELADTGNLAAVRTMLALGWPTEVTAAWDATALNLAIFRGDAAMTALLLDHGADWRTRTGYGGNALATLGYASLAVPEDPSAPRDHVGCARALLAHGVPAEAWRGLVFSDAVAAALDRDGDDDGV